MSGIDRHTGREIGNFASACQGIEVIFSTALGERIMRRHFGGGIVELLGRLTRPELFAAFMTLIAVAIDTWEPRFSVRRISFNGSPDQLRTGIAGVDIDLDYMPRGHLGDRRVERQTTVSLLLSRSGAQLLNS